ncbi:three-Cys-motif partner protein TcmP [Ferrimicrobium sp.]|uniref:three-Cys-motif partner protein TcmP n=1 Tax=Ferrimicrobium sp. TaxID=2926050 RepID=UPI0026135CAB|nr:three-Cys-motif partner protein TcmP [Ferrimicrobium sp.]
MPSSLWPIQEHTKAKHVLLKAYLDQWFPIMARYEPSLIFIDGFAGPGRYSGGEPGSPIVALQSVLDHPSFQNFKGHILFAFFEKNEAYCSNLQQELRKEADSRGGFPAKLKIVQENTDFATGIRKLSLGSLKNERQAGPILAFVDPFGFSGIRLLDIIALLNRPKCELLFNLMSDSMVRFRKHPNEVIQQDLSDFYGGNQYLQDFDEGSVSDNLASVFKDSLLRQSRFKYVRTFKMVNYRGKANFLIFATQHPKGVKAMKDAMWKVDPTRGKRFSAVESDPLFAGIPDFLAFEREVVDKFHGQSVKVAEIEEFVTLESDFRKEQLRDNVLRPLESRALIKVTRSGKQGYNSEAIIQFN